MDTVVVDSLLAFPIYMTVRKARAEANRIKAIYQRKAVSCPTVGKPGQEPCSPGNRILAQSTVEVHSIKSAYTASQPPVLSNLPCHKQGAVK